MQNDSNLETKEAKSHFKYQCKCGGLILPEFNTYQIDDEVNFMIQKRKNIGNGLISVNQKSHTGKIIKIEGDDITVKTHVRTYQLYRYEITPKDAPGPIEYFRIGKCHCELNKEKNP